MGYTAGFSQGVTFTPDGGSLATLKVKGHNWDEMVNKLNTTHTGSGGKAACIASYLDGNGNINAGYDSAQLLSAVSVTAATKGVITFALGTASPLSVHVMITKVHRESSVEGWVIYNFDVAMDSTTGSYTLES